MWTVMKVAVVDLGFNSLKMVNYRVGEGGSFEAYDQRGVMAKLGDGLALTGVLREDAMLRTLGILRTFREVADTQETDRILPITTSPAREANNGRAFLRRAKRETGFDFRVLTGREEALLSFLGAAKALELSNSVFFDLGGGSLEIISAKGGRPVQVRSLPLGALMLTQEYSKLRDTLSKKDLGRMEGKIRRELPSRKEIRMPSMDILAGVGGSVRALARYDQELKRYPLTKAHNYVLKRGAVENIFEALSEMSTREIGKIQAIGNGRAESIKAGALVVKCMMEKFAFEELHVSTHGLRDGVLCSFLDDPYVCLKGPVTEAYVARAARTSPWPDSLIHSRPLIKAMMTSRRVRQGDLGALAHAVRLAITDIYCLDPPTLFYSSVYEDSPLSHSLQVAASIALVRTRKPRVAEWLSTKHRALMEDADRHEIPRLASLIAMAEILERTECELSVRSAHDSLQLVAAPSEKRIPTGLFEEALVSLQDEYGVPVSGHVEKGPNRWSKGGLTSQMKGRVLA